MVVCNRGCIEGTGRYAAGVGFEEEHDFTACGKILLASERRSPGLKAIRRDLRGSEEPLFHGYAGVLTFW